jgi:hypothetical protein
MIFGGLSEKEINKISHLLNENNIGFKVQTDTHIEASNSESIKFNLRHLNSPSISTHVLAIEIEDEDFEQMNEKLASQLLEFGITNVVPEDYDPVEESDPSETHAEIRKGNKRLIGIDFGLQLLVIGIVAVVVLILKNKF